MKSGLQKQPVIVWRKTMSSDAYLNIARDFKRAEPAKGEHPLRGTLRREHLLRRDADDEARDRRIMIRDTLISVMGGISALVPMYVAIQTTLGA
jgi:PHD/YefM family antitoxin component YafN of YafNO toxin-antitoxin module